MAGFRNLAQWAAAPDAGCYHLTTFRKAVASAATVANDFIDYTYFAGNPPANFYASAPLEAATVEGIRGIHLPQVSSQYLKRLTVMSAASSATATTNQNQRLLLADYLLYYPFVDTDAVGEQQDMVQSAALPRYATGAGVQIMAVAQSASSTVGTFTVSYTNQDGVAKLPPIPQGKVRVQVIAKGYQTFGNVYELNQDEQTIEIKVNPPQAQFSVHQ